MREGEKRASGGEHPRACVHQGRQARHVAWDFTVAGAGLGGTVGREGGISSQQRIQRQDRKSGRKQTRSTPCSRQPGCGVVVDSAARPDPPPRSWEPGAPASPAGRAAGGPTLAPARSRRPPRSPLAAWCRTTGTSPSCRRRAGRRRPRWGAGGGHADPDAPGMAWGLLGAGDGWATCITSHYRPLTYTSFLFGFPLCLLFAFWFKLST